MTTAAETTLTVRPSDAFTFAYDEDSDIAWFRVDHAAPSFNEDLGSSWHSTWYLMVTEADEVAGLEIHGLRRLMEGSPFYASLLRPALCEASPASEGRLDRDIELEGNVKQFPKMAFAMAVMLGAAVERYEESERQGAWLPPGVLPES